MPGGYTPRAGKFRRPGWLQKHRYGPNVFVFRNLETNQVLYTQTPFPQRYNIKKQFQGPNWQNRLPTTRNDLWRAMAVAQLPTYDSAVKLYENLVQLRHMRDRTHKSQADAWRKKNDEGNIWYFSQFRPTYTQEAVADLVSSLEHLNVVNGAPLKCTLHWEDPWRRGDASHWQPLEETVQHAEFPRYNPRERFVVLRQIADQSYADYFRNKAYEGKALLQSYIDHAKARIEARSKDPIPAHRDPPGGPSKRWPADQLQKGIEERQAIISRMMSRAQETNQLIRSLPDYGNAKLRRRLRSEGKQQHAILKRVQRSVERYRKAQKQQRRLAQMKKARKAL